MTRFAADENFPEPLLRAIAPHLPFELQPLRHIDPSLTGGVEDWEVLLGLSKQRWDGLITTDYDMLTLPKEMAVLHQTKLTLVAVAEATHNPLIAAGEVLVFASLISKVSTSDRAQVFRIPRRRLTPARRAWDVLGEIASSQDRSLQEIFDKHKLTDGELRQ